VQENLRVSQINPIVSGNKIKTVVGDILNRIGAVEGPVYLIKSEEIPSMKDKATKQKPKVKEIPYLIKPQPAAFNQGLKEQMEAQGLVVTGDYKFIISTEFSIENDTQGKPIPYEWQYGDIILYKNLKWYVYMFRFPTLDSTIITYIVYGRKLPSDGYVPAPAGPAE
jgi:hypothetical protein